MPTSKLNEPRTGGKSFSKLQGHLSDVTGLTSTAPAGALTSHPRSPHKLDWTASRRIRCVATVHHCDAPQLTALAAASRTEPGTATRPAMTAAAGPLMPSRPAPVAEGDAEVISHERQGRRHLTAHYHGQHKGHRRQTGAATGDGPGAVRTGQLGSTGHAPTPKPPRRRSTAPASTATPARQLPCSSGTSLVMVFPGSFLQPATALSIPSQCLPVFKGLLRYLQAGRRHGRLQGNQQIGQIQLHFPAGLSQRPWQVRQQAPAPGEPTDPAKHPETRIWPPQESESQPETPPRAVGALLSRRGCGGRPNLVRCRTGIDVFPAKIELAMGAPGRFDMTG
jgi:hypothetical protein